MLLSRKLFSAKSIVATIKHVVRRFPLPFTYFSVFCVWLAANPAPKSLVVDYAATLALFEGFLLALAANIWCEFMELRRWGKPLQWVVAALVAADFVIITAVGHKPGQATELGHFAFVTALGTMILFTPGRLVRRRMWAYTMLQVKALCIAAALAATLCIAVGIILLTIDTLFSVSLDTITRVLLTFFGLWVPAVIYLARTPRPKDTSEAVNRIFLTASKNILLPVVAIYTLILYAYGLKILFSWDLPQASLSTMVSGLICASMVLIYALQGYTFGNNGRPATATLAHRIRRWLPPVLLPLLVLMAVGLIYRLRQYGVTASRLYLAVFVVWAAGTIVYMIVRRKAKLNYVAASFAVVFAAVSVLPEVNLTTLANGIVRRGVISELKAAGADSLPLSIDHLRHALAQMPREEAQNIASKIEYLDDWNDHSQVADIVDAPYKLTKWYIMDGITTATTRRSLQASGALIIPAGFSHMKSETVYTTTPAKALGGDSLSFSVGDYSVTMSLTDFNRCFNSKSHLTLNATNNAGENAAVVFERLTLDETDHVFSISSMRYYLFTD